MGKQKRNDRGQQQDSRRGAKETGKTAESPAEQEGSGAFGDSDEGGRKQKKPRFGHN